MPWLIGSRLRPLVHTRARTKEMISADHFVLASDECREMSLSATHARNSTSFCSIRSRIKNDTAFTRCLLPLQVQPPEVFCLRSDRPRDAPGISAPDSPRLYCPILVRLAARLGPTREQPARTEYAAFCNDRLGNTRRARNGIPPP
jgi:hypothetical protein